MESSPALGHPKLAAMLPLSRGVGILSQLTAEKGKLEQKVNQYFLVGLCKGSISSSVILFTGVDGSIWSALQRGIFFVLHSCLISRSCISL